MMNNFSEPNMYQVHTLSLGTMLMAGWSSCFFCSGDSYLVNGLAAAVLASVPGNLMLSLYSVLADSLVLATLVLGAVELILGPLEPQEQGDLGKAS